MQDLIVQGMLGLGDNLHQRAVVRELVKSHTVWLITPWPSLFWDMAGPHLKFVKPTTKLRTQARNAQREASSYVRVRPPVRAGSQTIWYTQPEVIQHGGFLNGMLANAKTVGRDFSLPIKPEWAAKAAAWLAKWGPTKPLMLYRPLVVRNEWAGCTQRNPDPASYTALARAVAERFFVVSVADLVPGVEWAVSDDIRADVELHQGELDVETIAALAARAGLVWASPGFMLVMAQAVNVPLVAVFGGHESARLYDHGRQNNHFIQPIRPCECFSKTHRCDKRIDIPRATADLLEFINDHHPQPRIHQAVAATV